MKTATKALTRRNHVRNATFKLLKQEGLTGWRVRFNSRLTRALGQCNYTTKTIEYQPRYMEQNDMAQVLTTIQHEVAHAVAGYGAAHGAQWREVARRLGLENPGAINRTATLTRKFTGTCVNGHTTTADRRNLRSACGKCCNEHNGVLFSAEYKFTWTRND